jgi:AraC-like DNA-binding protein
MYTIKELLDLGQGHSDSDIWNGQVSCVEVDGSRMASEYNVVSTKAYAFALVEQGKMSVEYDGRCFTIRSGDLLIYAPALNFRQLSATPDYRGWFLIADERVMQLSPLLHHLATVAYFPQAQLDSPCLSLTSTQAEGVRNLFRRIRHYIIGETVLKQDAICAALGMLVVDLLDIQNRIVERHRVSSRDEELFNAFLALVATDYIDHRDISYYADCLCISTTYLSRVVRFVSGHTVMHFVGQHLAADAALRLKTTTITIAQIADNLLFPDASTFSKFFKRMKGVSPKEYRKGE